MKEAADRDTAEQPDDATAARRVALRIYKRLLSIIDSGSRYGFRRRERFQHRHRRSLAPRLEPGERRLRPCRPRRVDRRSRGPGRDALSGVSPENFAARNAER